MADVNVKNNENLKKNKLMKNTVKELTNKLMPYVFEGTINNTTKKTLMNEVFTGEKSIFPRNNQNKIYLSALTTVQKRKRASNAYNRHIADKKEKERKNNPSNKGNNNTSNAGNEPSEPNESNINSIVKIINTYQKQTNHNNYLKTMNVDDKSKLLKLFGITAPGERIQLQGLKSSLNTYVRAVQKESLSKNKKNNLRVKVKNSSTVIKELLNKHFKQQGGKKKKVVKKRKPTGKKKVRKIHKGPRGGRYYISKGKKVYL